MTCKKKKRKDARRDEKGFTKFLFLKLLSANDSIPPSKFDTCVRCSADVEHLQVAINPNCEIECVSSIFMESLHLQLERNYSAYFRDSLVNFSITITYVCWMDL